MLETLYRLLIASTLLVLGPGCTSDNPGFIVGQPCSSAQGTAICGGGTVCDPQQGICTCPAGAAACGDACVDLGNDADHCGGCGLSCPAGEACLAGRCSGGGCPAGALDCDTRCVDPRSDPENCGGCRDAGGLHCGDGEACIDGACVQSPCAFGATLCGETCVDLDSSLEHCGRCGSACGADQTCLFGDCVALDSCPPSLARCGDACVDLAHDPTNCGECNQRCGKEEVCATDEGGRAHCRDYRFAGCNTCPCETCGERACCTLPSPDGGVRALCVEDRCPLPY